MAVMTAVTNNRRRPWPWSPMTADAHDRGHPKRKKKKKTTKKKKERRSCRRSPITGVVHDRGRPWPRTPMTAVSQKGKKKKN